MYCRSCRKWFPNNILFCDICGKPLVKDLDIYGENFFNGDVQAFDYIYQNSYNWVAGEVRKMFSANSSEVEDCVQEIYLLLYRKIKYYDPRQGSFSAWFNALVRNRIYDYGRKLAGNREILPETSQQYFKEITDRNVYINPEARIEYAEREQILDEILDDIGEGQRICIQMYYNDGLKIKEIAQILNISEGTVKSRKGTLHISYASSWIPFMALIQRRLQRKRRLQSIIPCQNSGWAKRFTECANGCWK